MNILLTGASSFTGYWFAKALSEGGHRVVATLRAPRTEYLEGVRAERVRRLAAVAEIVDEAPFGGERFLSVARGAFDALCHHAARVGDYRSRDFDIPGALAENTANLHSVLEALVRGGLRGVVLTGSVFEQNEGVGETPLVAFSPYGLSKGLTAEIVRYRCRELGLRFCKFVIPNPFGPLEEPRFCAYLTRSWRNGEVARVNTPDYVRDNIHVSLLAAAYAKFVGEMAGGKGRDKLNPSGYVEFRGRSLIASPRPCDPGSQCHAGSSSRFRPTFRSPPCGSISTQLRDMWASGMKAQPGTKRRRDIAVERAAGHGDTKTEFQ